MDDPSLDCRHCLELDDLAGLEDALRRPVGDVPELLLPPAAIVLDVDCDPVVLPLAPPDDSCRITSWALEFAGMITRSDASLTWCSTMAEKI